MFRLLSNSLRIAFVVARVRHLGSKPSNMNRFAGRRPTICGSLKTRLGNGPSFTNLTFVHGISTDCLPLVTETPSSDTRKMQLFRVKGVRMALPMITAGTPTQLNFPMEAIVTVNASSGTTMATNSPPVEPNRLPSTVAEVERVTRPASSDPGGLSSPGYSRATLIELPRNAGSGSLNYS